MQFWLKPLTRHWKELRNYAEQPIKLMYFHISAEQSWWQGGTGT